MDAMQAMQIAEGLEEPLSDEHHIEAWQTLIDTGLAWTLQGWFGRLAAHMIEAGHCHIGSTLDNDNPEVDF